MSDTEPDAKRARVDEAGTAVATLEKPVSAADGMERATEASAGMTEFLSSHPPLGGIVKSRFMDFVVQEVTLDGTVVCASVEPSTATAAAAASAEVDTVDPKTLSATLATLLSDDECAQLQELLRNAVEGSSVALAAREAKEERGALHRTIREEHGALLDSITRDGQIVVVFRDLSKKPKGKSRKPIIPERRGVDCPAFTAFVLHKINTDTLQACGLIANRLGIPTKHIGFAGTKDRRGVTSQMMTVARVSPERLLKVNTTLRGITVSDPRPCESPLRLGDLSGNRFGIVLRDIDNSAPIEQIEGAMQSLAHKGFINYYGLQRFGTTSVPTFEVGKAVLRNDFKKAVDLLLGPHESNHDMSAKGRQIWATTRDARKTYDALPTRAANERLVLKALMRAPDDYRGAFGLIPRTLRTLYLHSYQSLLFNLTVSFRLRRYGHGVVVGDLLNATTPAPPVTVTEQEKPQEVSQAEVPASSSSFLGEPLLLPEHDKILKVRPATEADVASGQFSLQHVLLPVIGTSSVLPENEVKDELVRLLALDGFTLDSFSNRVKDYALYGDYRYIVMVPKDIRWELMRYADRTTPLIRTPVGEGKDIVPSSIPDAPFRALVVHMTLNSSTYATMALREIMKTSTSSADQSALM